MNWSTPDDLMGAVRKRWEQGRLLQSLLAAGDWPWRLPLKAPGSQDITDCLPDVRAWTAALAAMPQVRLEWREVRHRVQGTQRVVKSVWLENIDAAAALIDRQAELERFRGLIQLTLKNEPAALPWLARRPLRALELASEWSALLGTVTWRRAHPQARVFVRMVDVPGAHSKLIEQHSGVLAELLELALPEGQIDALQTRFARRFGFRERPARVRMRSLDPAYQLLPGLIDPDLTLDVTNLKRLAPTWRRIVITENETNYLVFPSLPESLLIFGSGYGFDALAELPWMQEVPIHYWGDIDSHGFKILDQLRAHFPHAQSLLMDEATLLAHREFWGIEPEPVRHPLKRLTENENALFEALRSHRFAKNLRLEQERIRFSWLAESSLFGSA